jgi:hypothetical protein
MPYWEIVTRSFGIAWQRKYIWLIALFSGEGGGASFNYSQSTTRPPAGTTGGSGTGTGQVELTQVTDQVGAFVSTHAALLLALAVLSLVLIIGFFLLAAICEGATVRAAAEHDAERPFGLGIAWRVGVSLMWTMVRFRLLLIALGLPLLVLFLGFIAGLVFAIATSSTGAAIPLALAGLVLLVVGVPYLIYLFFLDRLGSRALVLEQLAARASLARAHRLLRKRLGRVLLVWLVSIGVGIALGIGLACAFAIVAIPLVLIGIGVGTASSAALIPLIVLGVILLLPLALLVNGFVAAQGATYWTLAFRRLDVDYASAPAYPYYPTPPPAPPPGFTPEAPTS